MSALKDRSIIAIRLDGQFFVGDVIDLMLILPRDAQIGRVGFDIDFGIDVLYVGHSAFPVVPEDRPIPHAKIIRDKDSRIKWLEVPGMPKLIRADPC